ncbi:DegT/DnrJ/EryC1/StrS family aminotransferase [Prochlorococcus sp. MIT 1307]|uniref:DegT/DnrJ/EryC1/StrS family aminotransferase n=1 Tax=Prochlorococcus sp. MIT 1307 TaxID=3096219 RepID=UPI002A76394F|nr:DegT/DnrJ/EryC1/StrS family aminotransferase [Prochlorococcus sp. MIT 1307]
MKVLCSDPLAQYDKYRLEIDAAIRDVLFSGNYILSDQVQSLEQEYSAFLNCNHVIGVANGTDAIELVLRALDIGHGDEVITVSHTAVATVSAIQSAGAKPILVDIKSESFTINTDLINEKITKRTKAVIPVHIYGRSANLNKIKQICNDNKLYLIEDCAQAHGLKTKSGAYVGTVGIAGCFSCYPTKNLGGIGDAGLISTNSAVLADKLRAIRQYGWKDRANSSAFGRNSRIDEIQAAILRVKLKYLEANNILRRDLAKTYKSNLQNLDLILPNTDNDDHVYHLYVVRSNKRDKLKKYLFDKNILAGIHYPIPIHKQSIFIDNISTSNDMSTTELLANEILSLPIYPELSLQKLNYVTDSIREFFTKSVN